MHNDRLQKFNKILFENYATKSVETNFNSRGHFVCQLVPHSFGRGASGSMKFPLLTQSASCRRKFHKFTSYFSYQIGGKFMLSLRYIKLRIILKEGIFHTCPVLYILNLRSFLLLVQNSRIKHCALFQIQKIPFLFLEHSADFLHPSLK